MRMPLIGTVRAREPRNAIPSAQAAAPAFVDQRGAPIQAQLNALVANSSRQLAHRALMDLTHPAGATVQRMTPPTGRKDREKFRALEKKLTEFVVDSAIGDPAVIWEKMVEAAADCTDLETKVNGYIADRMKIKASALAELAKKASADTASSSGAGGLTPPPPALSSSSSSAPSPAPAPSRKKPVYKPFDLSAPSSSSTSIAPKNYGSLIGGFGPGTTIAPLATAPTPAPAPVSSRPVVVEAWNLTQTGLRNPKNTSRAAGWNLSVPEVQAVMAEWVTLGGTAVPPERRPDVSSALRMMIHLNFRGNSYHVYLNDTKPREAGEAAMLATWPNAGTIVIH